MSDVATTERDRVASTVQASSFALGSSSPGTTFPAPCFVEAPIASPTMLVDSSAHPSSHATSTSWAVQSHPLAGPRGRGRAGYSGIGNLIQRWHVSTQAPGPRGAHCARCKEAFLPHGFRLHATRTLKKAIRFFHVGCVDAALPLPTQLDGFSDLDQEARTALTALLHPEPPGPGSPHSLHSHGGDLGSVASHLSTCAPEDVGLDDMPTTYTPFETFSRLEWWDTVPWDTLLTLEVETTYFTPAGLEGALAALKGDLYRYIENFGGYR